MTFIKDNFELIVIILFILAFIILLSILSFNRYFVRYFSNKKFQITTAYEIDAVSQKKQFVISIYNKNINDVRVAGFGYVYQNQNIDFYKSYLMKENLPNDHKVVIPSRDYICAKIEVDNLKTIISDINKGNRKVSELKVFVTDSLGLTAQTRARAVKKQLYKHLKEDRIERLRKIKEQQRKQKEDAQVYKDQKKIGRKVHRKEILGKWILRVRGIFRKRNK